MKKQILSLLTLTLVFLTACAQNDYNPNDSISVVNA